MPVVSKDIIVLGSQQKVWNLLSDPVQLGNCIPGCEEVITINATDSKWKLKIVVGVIARRVETKVKVLQRKELETLVYRVDSTDGSITAQFKIDLKPDGTDSMTISFTANVEASGAFQWVVNQVIKTQLDKFIDQFTTCVSSKMKTSS